MRQRHGRVFSRFCVGLVLAVALLAVSAGSAGAKNTKPKHNTCTGTTDNFPTELGTLSGTYSGHVKISGACAVDAGPTTINGNLTIGKGSTLIAQRGNEFGAGDAGARLMQRWSRAEYR